MNQGFLGQQLPCAHHERHSAQNQEVQGDPPGGLSQVAMLNRQLAWHQELATYPGLSLVLEESSSLC